MREEENQSGAARNQDSKPLGRGITVEHRRPKNGEDKSRAARHSATDLNRKWRMWRRDPAHDSAPSPEDRNLITLFVRTRSMIFLKSATETRVKIARMVVGLTATVALLVTNSCKDVADASNGRHRAVRAAQRHQYESIDVEVAPSRFIKVYGRVTNPVPPARCRTFGPAFTHSEGDPGSWRQSPAPNDATPRSFGSHGKRSNVSGSGRDTPGQYCRGPQPKPSAPPVVWPKDLPLF